MSTFYASFRRDDDCKFLLRKIEKDLRARIISCGLEVWASSILIFSSRLWDHHPFIDLACTWKRSWSVKVSFFLGFMNLLKKEIHCCQKSCPISWRSHACSFFAIVILRNPFTCWNNKVFVQISIFEGRQISRTFWKNAKKLKSF